MFQIMINSQVSMKIKITEGVLQGEILSRLWFAIFINYMEAYFRRLGIRGVNIDGNNDVLF